MSFQALQEKLRRRVLAHIAAGQMTGLQLAQLTGFRQAHISNFLNRKRALSLEAMDRVLAALRWSVVDLLEDSEIARRAARFSAAEDEYENVPLVEGPVAAGQPTIPLQQVRDILKFKRAFLRRLRPDSASARGPWLRFVLVKVDAREGMSMYPRTMPGATLLIDRHYNSLRPYRKGERNMYAVRYHGGWTVKYVELAGRNLVLRPHNEAYPVSVQAMSENETPGDYIIGRVCHVGIET